MQTMKKDENAVSPVIGVILMVVITVIIAAILAVFAFGIGAPKNAPAANLKYKVDAPSLVITVSHGGGDPLVLADEKLILNDAVTPFASGPEEISLDNLGCTAVGTSAAGTLTAGNALECAYTSSVVAGGIYRVQVLDKPTGQLVSDTRVVAQ